MPGRRSVPCRETWQPNTRPPRDQSDERYGLTEPVVFDTSQFGDLDLVRFYGADMPKPEGPFQVYASLGADLSDPDLPHIDSLLYPEDES